MTRQLRFESFESALYLVKVDSNYGVWHIVRKHDNAQTLLETCNEGYENYRKLKKVWRCSKTLFNTECAEYTFDNPEMEQVQHA